MAAEAAASEKEKRDREREAVETIVMLWTHRSTYENRINPFFELKPIIEVARTLDPRNNPWLIGNGTTNRLYETFRRLTICLLLRGAKELDTVSSALSTAQKTSEFQSDEEKELVATLNTWMALANEEAEIKVSRKRAKVPDEEVDLDEVCKRIVEELRSVLDEILNDIARRTVRRPSFFHPVQIETVPAGPADGET